MDAPAFFLSLLFTLVEFLYCLTTYVFFASNVIRGMLKYMWLFKLSLGYAVWFTFIQHLAVHLRIGFAEDAYWYPFGMAMAFSTTGLFVLVSGLVFCLSLKHKDLNKFYMIMSASSTQNYTAATYMGLGVALLLGLNSLVHFFIACRRYRRFRADQKLKAYNLRTLYTIYGRN